MEKPDQPVQSKPRRWARQPRTRSVLAATCLLVIGVSPFAIAKTGDVLRQGKRNGTTTRETEIISKIKASSGAKGGYSTRQSNLSSTGGGAIYGCRASSATGSDPCVRASNLSSGRAFEFSANDGLVAGVITAGTGGDTKKPFVTNATGVASGLNADRVDGKDSTDLLPRFAQVTAGGTLGETRGLASSGAITHTAASGVYAILFAGDLSKCALSATLTSASGGEVAATPAVASGNTTVTVRTSSSAGVPADRDFHLLASC